MKFKAVLRYLAGIFTRRLWLKLLSLALALILWTYIITNNTSLTRNKTLTGVSVSTGTVSTLTSRSLALATDISTEISAVSVTVNVPQSRFGTLTSSMVRVTPDYSRVSNTGTYEVPLTATCSYGTVTEIEPSYITVEIDALDTRDITVDAVLTNRDTDSYWYSVDSDGINPQTVTVSGPASIISTLAGATVTLDVSGRTESYRRSQLVSFTDHEGETLSTKLLTKSSSTCSVSVNIYPKKTLELRIEEAQFNVPEGYEVTDITCVPSSVTVAAEQELLDSMEYIPLELPSNATHLTGTATVRVSIGGISDFKYISTKQVYVTVTVAPIEYEDEEDAQDDAAVTGTDTGTETGN